jgi:hypothetical protein
MCTIVHIFLDGYRAEIVIVMLITPDDRGMPGAGGGVIAGVAPVPEGRLDITSDCRLNMALK